jgi:hypothetical protein
MFRDQCGGGKGGGSAYDPQIGRAASQAASTADRAQTFAESYFNGTIKPLLEQQTAASTDAQTKMGRLYDINADQMQTASERYKQFGIPAEQRYYDMVSKYSAPEEQERQALAAKGDLGVAMGNQRAGTMRQFSGLGIDPTSGAAVSALTNQAVMNAAAEAGAMNRARNAARDMGMKLTSDAANFGRGGQSGILQFGAGAQGNAAGAFGVANAALGTGMNAGNSVQAGYQTAMSGYNNIMDNYTRMGQADIQAQAASSPMQGLGQLGGIVLGQGLPAGFLSDIRTKQDMHPVGQLPSGITIYTYKYRPEYRDQWGHGQFRGVIAQEVAPVIPEAIIYDQETGHLLVDYSKLR